MPEPLSQLQSAVAARLRSDPALEAVPLLTRSQSDLAARIDEAVQRGLGLCVVVGHPLPERIVPDAPGPVAEAVGLAVEVVENIASTTAPLTALEAASAISRRLHLWRTGLAGWPEPLRLLERSPWREETDRRRPNRLVLAVRFILSGTL
jgi:hypothetical protein